MAKIIIGDIFQSDNHIAIAHQCNCTTFGARGIASDIFKKYPYANVYGKNIRKCGTIQISGDIERGERTVIAMFAQYYPNKPSENDTCEQRKNWFVECLENIVEGYDGDIAFPFGIGCGLAAGNWRDYRTMIDIFSAAYHGNVFIYKLEK